MGLNDLVKKIINEEHFDNKYAKTIMRQFKEEDAKVDDVVSDRTFTVDRLSREEGEDDFYLEAVRELEEKGYIESVDGGVRLTEVGYSKLKDF